MTLETIDSDEPFKITWLDYKIHPEYDKVTEGFTDSSPLNPLIWISLWVHIIQCNLYCLPVYHDMVLFDKIHEIG